MNFARVVMASVALLVVAGLSPAQLVTYAFTPEGGAAGNAPGNQASTAALTVATGLTATNLSRGGGLTPTATAGSISSTGFDTTYVSTSGASTDYYTFTLNANPSGQFNLSSLGLGVRRSGTGPTTGEVRTSLDNFATAYGTMGSGSDFTIPTAEALVSVSFGTGGLTSSANQASVEIRVYAATAGMTAGTFRLEDVGSTAGVVLNGSFTPVPEPATVLAVAAAGLGGLRLRRRLARA